jgi:large repetitive protein
MLAMERALTDPGRASAHNQEGHSMAPARITLGVVGAVALSIGVGARTPTVTDLGLVPGDRAVVLAPNAQTDASAAAGTASTLIVWSDMRSRSSGCQTVQSDADILGVRVDATGRAIDAVPFVIAGGMGVQDAPRVAFNGTTWMVLFRSQDPSATYYETRIRMVRVSQAGEVLDPTPLTLPPSQFTPDTIGLTIAGLNGHWLIVRCVYYSTGYGTFLAGQRVSASGTILDPSPITLMDWVYGQIKVASTGTECLVAGPDWTDSSITKARRIGSSGQPIAAAFTLPANAVAIGASAAGEYYAAWQPNTTTTLRGSRLSPNGSLVTPGGTLLLSDFSSAGTTLAHDGTNWWLAWGVSNIAKTMRISAAGNVLDPGGVTLPIIVSGNINTLYSTQITPRPGGGALFTWVDHRAALGSDGNVFTLPLAPNNTPGIESPVSLGSSTQRSSSATKGPAGTAAVAYVSDTAGIDRALVQIYNASGTPVGVEPIEVASAPAIGRAGIAWNGSVYMIAWDEATTPGQSTVVVKARRMRPDGTFVDAAPFTVMTGFSPDVGALGDRFLVVGARYGYTPQYISLLGSRIDGASGALLDGPAGIMLGGYYVSGLSRVRSDGTNWWVATHSMWSHNSSQGDAVLFKVPYAGAPDAGFNPTPIAGGSGDLDIAFGGGVYLLVWRNNSMSNANNFVAGRIMNADGTFPGASFVIADAPGRQLRPTAVFDGTNFIVAWDDQRNQASFFDDRTDVYAVRVSTAGALVDAVPFPVVDRPGVECSPALVSVGGGFYAWTTRYVTDGAFDSYRVGMSRIGPASCAADFDRSGSLAPADVFAFLSAYFAGAPETDMNGDGSRTPADIFSFLGLYFAGCAST